MIPAERAHLHIAALTHPGMSGKNNEDRYAVSAFRLEGEESTPTVFAIISDGIGGHRAGEVAATMVVETVSQAVAKSNAQFPLMTLREAIMRSSQEISVEAESDPEKKGMGATCACALVVGERLYAAYVGDTRIYLIRSGAMRQISIDHTWVQEAIDAGIIEPEEAKAHPNAHVIRRYLGSKTNPEADFRLRLHPEDTDEQALANQGMLLQPGDFLILCSDGLTDLVDKAEILAALKSQSREAALQNLTNLANERGGHDNITMVVLEAPATLDQKNLPAAQPAVSAQTLRKLALPCLIIALILGLLGAAGAGLFLYFERATPTVTPTLSLTVRPTTLPILQDTQTPAATTRPAPLGATPTPTGMAAQQANTPEATYTPWPTNTLPPATSTATVTPSATEAPTPTPTPSLPPES